MFSLAGLLTGLSFGAPYLVYALIGVPFSVLMTFLGTVVNGVAGVVA